MLIPLFQAERAWAYAMQLKQEANTEPRKKFRLVNRLKKCVKFASELEKLSESEKCDARTKLEAQGYSSLISGQFNFETQKWNESLKYFNVSKYEIIKFNFLICLFKIKFFFLIGKYTKSFQML